MKKLLVCLVGETGSGKDSVANMLPYPKIVSYTSRPMRQGEENGVQHHFVSNEFFDRNKMLAYTKTGDYQYGVPKDSIINDISIYIINPEGIRWMNKYSNTNADIKLLVIGLYLPLEERAYRCISKRNDDICKFYKRVADEQSDYNMFRLNGEFDAIFKNTESEQTANYIQQMISNTYMEMMKNDK